MMLVPVECWPDGRRSMNVQTEVEKLILAEWGPMNGPNHANETEAPSVPAVPDWFATPTGEAWKALSEYAREILSHGSLDRAAEAHWMQLLWYAERQI